MHLDITYLSKLRTELHEYAVVRRDIINQSGNAQHHAKRAIFALHRDAVTDAETLLQESRKIFSTLHKTYKKHSAMYDEGAYKAAIEEFVEAELFYQFVTRGRIEKVPGMAISAESYLGGLCDVPGELYRYAIRAATNRNTEILHACAAMGQDIIGQLIEFNLTSYLRNKFDQAKGAAQKLEQVVYEVSLRERE